jgi:hypothetical protein
MPVCGALPVGPSLDLRMVDPLSFPGWDALVGRHPEATFFHGAAWAKTLADAYGFNCCYIAMFEGAGLRALLPIMETCSWLRGKRGVSLPFTDECPPLAPDGAAGLLLDSAMQQGKLRGWKSLDLRGGLESFPSISESVSFYTHLLRLKSSSAELFETFDSSVRRAIRKAERCGVAVECHTDLEAVRAYYRLHCRTRTRHGAPPQPFGFFRSLWENVLQKGQGFVTLAMHRDRPVAGAVFLQFGRKAIYKFSASDERYQELRGPNLVIWQAVKKLVDEGAVELNFGRTSLSNEGLRRFKRYWNAEERIVHYARYCFERQKFVKVADLAAGLQARIFALLPVFLSRWVGRAVYAHMS